MQVMDGSKLVVSGSEKETQIEIIWKEILGVDSVRRDDDFFKLGGTDLKAIMFTERIEKAYGFEMPARELFTMRTFGEIENHITGSGFEVVEGDVADADNRSVMVLNRKTGNNIFCFPLPEQHGMTEYYYFSEHFDKHTIITFDHIYDRDRILSNGEIVERYIGLIKSIQPVGPYVLLGKCFGGILAYYTAHELIGRGDRVSKLIILDAQLYHTYFGGENLYEDIVDIAAEANQKQREVRGLKRILKKNERVYRFLVASYLNLYRFYRIYVEWKNYVGTSFNLKYNKALYKLDTDIHYLVSPDRLGVTWWVTAPWKRSCMGLFRKHVGFGAHRDMMNQLFAGENARIVRGILCDLDRS